MKIAEFSIKRPSFVIVIFLVTTLAGILSFPQIGYQLIPDIAAPTLTITTVYPGAAPSEVENSVTRKIEDAIASLENIDDITSKSLESASLVIINFNSGTDIDLALQDAQRKVNNILSDLPENVDNPVISKVSPSDLPIIEMTATSNLDGKIFYSQMEEQIIPQLQQIKGVAAITMLGGEEREIRVAVNTDKLEYYKLSLLQVTSVINNANLDFPTGKVKADGDEITVRLAGKFTSIEEIKNLTLSTSESGSPIRVRDVAMVTDGVKEPESIGRLNGKNAIALRIQKQNDANTVEVSEAVRAKLTELENRYQEEALTFDIAQDSAEFTLEAVEAVLHDLVLAIVLVAAVMLFFLHSFRNALIVMIAIPASLIATVAFMYLLGYTFNLMTLLAMSLVIGILVDDSIVVLENIYRHMEMGKNSWKAAVDGISEIGFTAISITLVIIIVFIPVTFVQSVIADVFRQFSWVVVIATLFSLLVSFTLIPWLMSRFSKVTHLDKKNPFQWVLIQFESGINSLIKAYESSLHWIMQHKLVLFGVVMVLFIFIGWTGSLGIIGNEQFSSGDKGEFKLTLEYDKTTGVISNNLKTREIEKWISTYPEVDKIFTNVGGPTVGMGSTGLGEANKSEISITLVPEAERSIETERLMIEMMDNIRQAFSGVKVGGTVVGMVAQGTAPIEIFVTGEDYDEVIAAGDQLRNLIERTPGANDVKVSVEAGKPEVRVNLDRDKMAQFGLDIATVGATLQNSFQGNDDSKFRDGDYEYDILVQLNAFDRQNPEDVKSIPFINNDEELVKLEQFAQVSREAGPSLLERKDRVQSVTVTSYALGVPTGTLADNIKQKIAEADFPASVNFIWGGEIKQQTENFGALGSAFGISLILIYLILVLLYDNFVYPLVVLLSVPVALIGSILALALTQSTMSVFTILGLIMLLGLVAKNAILIVDFANKEKAEGKPTREAVQAAGKERLRPILMTTIAMVIGMVPIAIATGAGAEWKNALAWVIIGGLLSSLLLTIYVVPAAYEMVDNMAAWIGRVFKSSHKTQKVQKQLG